MERSQMICRSDYVRAILKRNKGVGLLLNEYMFNALTKGSRKRKKTIMGLRFDRPYIFPDDIPVTIVDNSSGIQRERVVGVCKSVEIGFGTTDRKPYAIADVWFFDTVFSDDIRNRKLYASFKMPGATETFWEVLGLYFA